MRIALLTDGIYPYTMGGMQKHSYYLAKHLAQNGIFVDVYHAIPENEKIPSFKNEYSPEELQFIRLIPIPFPLSKKYPGHYIKESYIYSKRIYKEFLKHADVDFVYIQGFSGWKLLKVCKDWNLEKRKPQVGVNFHGLNMFQKAPDSFEKLKQYLFKPFVKWNLRNADLIFSLGGKLTEIQRKIAPETLIIETSIGITQDWLVVQGDSSGAKPLKFIFIGRYDRVKGIEELNKVLIQLISERKYTFECHFIGPIPETKQIKGKVNLFYHGSIHEETRIKELLHSSDILLCPSWSEGMPTVILEAMANGCAIIATDVGAVSEQVDNKNGLLIKPGNIDQLKAAIEQMIALPADEIKKMKRVSIQRIKDKFLWENVAERTISEITKAISK